MNFKSILLAATAAIAVGGTAHAGGHTYGQFTQAYGQAVSEAQARGLVPQEICYSNYCANTVTLDYSDGVVFLANITLKSGVGLQEFCTAMKTNPSSRWCTASNGRTWGERWNGGSWEMTATYTTNFED